MTQRWSLGPYVLDPAGTLELDGTPVAMKPQHHRALLLLVDEGGLVSHERLSQSLWPVSPPRHPGALAQVIHGLRKVLDRGPLGGGVIQTVYGKGYAYTGPLAPLGGAPEPAAPLPQASVTRLAQGVSASILQREAWARWRSGDPRQLAEVVRLLSGCLVLEPEHREALVDLCHTRLLQAGWGMACTRATGLELQSLLKQAQSLAVEAHTLAALHAETLTTLFWQSQRSNQLYARWLPQHLPMDRPLLSWVRHLLYSGQSDGALELLNTRLRWDLPMGWGLKAFAHLQKGEWSEAAAASRQQRDLRGEQAAPSLELALALAQQGNCREAAALVEQTGVLKQAQPTTLHALAALSLAHGPQHAVAAELLKTMAQQHDQPTSTVGGLSLWGVGALALGESELATRLLTAAVRGRCGLAPVVWHGPLLRPYAHEPAVGVFCRGMARACQRPPGQALGTAKNSTKI